MIDRLKLEELYKTNKNFWYIWRGGVYKGEPEKIDFGLGGWLTLLASDNGDLKRTAVSFHICDVFETREEAQSELNHRRTKTREYYIRTSTARLMANTIKEYISNNIVFTKRPKLLIDYLATCELWEIEKFLNNDVSYFKFEEDAKGKITKIIGVE